MFTHLYEKENRVYLQVIFLFRRKLSARTLALVLSRLFGASVVTRVVVSVREKKSSVLVSIDSWSPQTCPGRPRKTTHDRNRS